MIDILILVFSLFLNLVPVLCLFSLSSFLLFSIIIHLHLILILLSGLEGREGYSEER